MALDVNATASLLEMLYASKPGSKAGLATSNAACGATCEAGRYTASKVSKANQGQLSKQAI